MERRARAVELEALDLYRCVIAKRHLGEVHESVVTGVSAAGPYCEIESPFLTGLLRHDEVGPEGWEIDELGVRISLGRSGFGYSLGDAVTVEISEVSIPRRTVYLALPPEVRERHAASRGKVRIVKSAKPAKGAKPTKGAKPAKAKGRKGR